MSEPMPRARKRALIMAGGGTKVAFQAGVLEVWLDEAKIEFDHADGASGGVFNLAMWAQGMTGRQIADNWRRYRPLAGVEVNLRGIMRLPFASSLFKMERFRRNVIGPWGLDWKAIRATSREATFNLYNFSRLEQVVVEASDMDEDRLISAVSLPMMFPPVSIDGDTYIDAVYATDANLEEAVRRGADELWVIWTVSQRGAWRPGFVAHYFQIIEAAANSQFRAILRRIEKNNEAQAGGGNGEFGRTIEVKLLQAEVPMHYLFNFTNDRVAGAVELGVAAARRWCVEQRIALPPTSTGSDAWPTPARGPVGARFTEEMKGFATLGVTDPDQGWRVGKREKSRLKFHLTIETDDLDRFVFDPDHAAPARGWVEADVLGGRFPVERGRFNLFVDQTDPARKRMLYELWFTDAGGFPLTLLGFKIVTHDRHFDLWSDTTTLHTRVVRGHVDWSAANGVEVVAAGVLRITPAMFARQLATFRGIGDTRGRRAAALARFGRLFSGKLWDVYVSPNDPPVLIDLGVIGGRAATDGFPVVPG